MKIEDIDAGSNSFKSKSKEVKKDDKTQRETRPKIANGVKVKPSKTSKMADIFFPEGFDMEDIWDKLLRERIAPGILAGLRSFCDDVLDAVFGVPSRRSDIYRREKHTPYSSISSLYRSSDKERDRDRDRDRQRRRPYSYAEVAFRTRLEAEEVLDAMEDALDKYHIVTVADLYEFAGENPEPTDFLYGWTSLKSARVDKIAGGNYAVIMPKASPID